LTFQIKKGAVRAGADATAAVIATRPTITDPRIMIDRSVNQEGREQILREFEATLQRHSLEVDETKKGVIVQNLVYIHKTAADIREKWIDMGKNLLRIYRESKEVYDAITASSSQILPFDYTVAIKLRKAAEEVERARVPVEQLPLTYPAVYEVYLMDQPMLEKAVERGVVQPRASREKLARFRKELKAELSAARSTVTPESLRAQISRLEHRKDEIRDEAEKQVREIDSQIAELWDKLRAIGPSRQQTAQEGDQDEAA
jgi:hypothetical protein